MLDGLWRCLCPSIDAATLTATLQRPVIQPRRLPVIQRRNAATRAYSGLPDALEQRMSRPQAQPVSSEGTPIEKCYSPRWKPPTISSSKYAHDSHSSWVYRMWKRHRELPISFFDQHSAPYEALDGLRTETIVEGLRELILAESQYHGICNIVRYLVTRRNRKPDVFLYECLIKANIDLHHGSARVVANILEEMDSRGILPTPAIFHSVLDVSTRRA